MKKNAWLVLLLVFLSPLILPLFLVVVTLIMALFILFVALIVMAIALIIMGIVVFICTVFLLFIHFPTAIMSFGFSLFITGLGILIFIPMTKLTQNFMAFIVRKVKEVKYEK